MVGVALAVGALFEFEGHVDFRHFSSCFRSNGENQHESVTFRGKMRSDADFRQVKAAPSY